MRATARVILGLVGMATLVPAAGAADLGSAHTIECTFRDTVMLTWDGAKVDVEPIHHDASLLRFAINKDRLGARMLASGIAVDMRISGNPFGGLRLQTATGELLNINGDSTANEPSAVWYALPSSDREGGKTASTLAPVHFGTCRVVD